MTLIANPLCTETDMERLLSAYGVTAFADHDRDGVADDGVADDCINQATEEIRGFAWMWYSDAQLATSTLVNRWATVLSCHFLCTRRGNGPPESLQAEFQRIFDLLQRVADGTYRIPGLALRGDFRPSMSNVAVDRRYPHSTIRVTRHNSTDAPTTLTQDQANEVLPYE